VSPLTRREFIAGAAGTAVLAAAAAACSSDSKSTSAGPATTEPMAGGLPDPGSAPFDTVVVLMMENRSFDHLLGWLPGADGKQAGLSFPAYGDPTRMVSTVDLGDNTQACGDKDPAHDWPSMVTQYNGGKLDGWLQTQPTGDSFPIGYYGSAQVPVMGALAQNYTVFDNYFCSLQAATWPNRFYQLCAATDVDLTGFFPAPEAPRPSNLQLSIFDRVIGAGLKAGYYYWDEPMTGLFASQRYNDISHSKDQFFADAAAGTLPNVTFIEPDYGTIAEFKGTSNDYHPHGDVLVGEAYLAEAYDAIKTSPQWDRTVFVLNFDENGGFYDHVDPPTVIDDNVNPNPGPHPNYSQLGFRVPAIAMGPFAPKKIESAGPYEHCSILRMIEWRWGLEPMTARDANAKNLAEALDFSTSRSAFDLPAFPQPPNPGCPSPTVALA
jgi:phospholipase C